MNLEQRIMNEVGKYLESDKIEQVVEKAMDTAVKDLFNRYGGLGDVIEKSLKKQMTPIIENYDYSEFVVKLEDVLQTVIKEQASTANNLMINFEGAVKPYPKSITLTEMFNEYCKYASKVVETTDLDIDYDDTPTYQNLTCQVVYSEQERYFSNTNDESGLIEFNCENDESLNFSVNVYKWSFSDNYIIVPEIESDLKKLKRLNAFEVYLLGLKINNTGLVMDQTEITDYDVEVVTEPELSYE